MQVATAVLQGSTTPGAGETRLMLLVGGPSTSGPSSIVGPLLEDNLRSHKDIKAGAKKAPLFDMANKFYLTLSEDLAQHGIVFDCFICSLEQVRTGQMTSVSRVTRHHPHQTDPPDSQNPLTTKQPYNLATFFLLTVSPSYAICML